jgi:phosphoribosylglycinamide formyltransferase-1
MKKIVILASGSGTNAENIVRYFEDSDLARVDAIITNNVKAGVIDRARKLGISCFIIGNQAVVSGELAKKLLSLKPDLIVLAGYLRLIPQDIIGSFPKRIINIHPALLPDYGGVGMYGKYVHQAVAELPFITLMKRMMRVKSSFKRKLKSTLKTNGKTWTTRLESLNTDITPP